MGFGNWMGGAASGAASGASTGPWGAAVGAGLGALGSGMGGKAARKPQTTTSVTSMAPFGGEMGNDILMQILQLAQDRFIDNAPQYVGPSPEMNSLFASIMGRAQNPGQYYPGGN